MSRGSAGKRGRRRATVPAVVPPGVAAVAVAVLLLGAGCDKTWTTSGERRAAPSAGETVSVGDGVALPAPPSTGEAPASTAAPAATSSGSDLDGLATTATTVDPHPRDANGDRILNRTVREAEALRLTFSIDGDLRYERRERIYFQLQVENLGAAPVHFDPDARDVIVVTGGGGVAWTNGSCLPDFGDDGFDTGAVAVEAGGYVTLDFSYEPESAFADDPGCDIPAGRWQVDARFPRCLPEDVERDRHGNPSCEGDRVTAVPAHPLAIDIA